MTIKDIEIGKTGVVTKVGGEGALRQHFLDMGVIPGAEVTVIKYAPMGDPIELRVHGYELTLRLADAEKIDVEPVQEWEAEKSGEVRRKKAKVEHPGLGESGKYHVKADENPLPEGTVAREPETEAEPEIPESKWRSLERWILLAAGVIAVIVFWIIMPKKPKKRNRREKPKMNWDV